MLEHLGPIALLNLGLSAVAFASFSWGVFGHFHAPANKIPARMKLLSFGNLGCFVILGYSLASWPSNKLAAVCAAIGFILSIALFASAIATTKHAKLHVAFSGARSMSVIASGPYRYIRHPFYASYMLFWMAGATATVGIVGWIAAATMIITYWRVAVVEEAELLASKAGSDYAAYSRRSGRFVPRFFHHPPTRRHGL